MGEGGGVFAQATSKNKKAQTYKTMKLKKFPTSIYLREYIVKIAEITM